MRISVRIMIATAVLFAFLITDSIVAQRRRPPINSGRGPFHLAGGKLLETETYQLYAQIPYNETKWCLGEEGSRRASVSLIFNVDENYVITNDEAYRRRFESEILPALQKECRPLAQVNLHHYFKNSKFVYVRSDVREYASNDPNYPGDERSFTIITAELDETGRFQFSKPQYASLAEFRQERRAKEEERARRQIEFEERQRERQKRLDAEAAEHARALAAESKNGQEPHSEDMALATLRAMYPACADVSFNEACEPVTGLSLRMVAATKFRCKAVTSVSDYHCAYSFKIDCNGHPLLCFGMESDLNSKTLKAGFRRSGQRWTIYAMSEAQRNAL